MKEIKSALIVLAIGVLLGLFTYFIFNDGYKTGYQKATETLIQRLDKCEADYKTCNKSLSEYEESDNEWNKFVEERCVCVSWQSSSNEEPMTKDQICNNPLSY